MKGSLKNASLVRVAAAALFAAAVYLPAPAADAASGRITFNVGEQARSAVVTERYRTKRKLRPAIILLGDSARSSAATRRGLPFSDFTRKGGVLVRAEAPGGAWKIGPDGKASAEVAYLRSLVAALRRESLADPKRIYLVGVGSGGLVALQAACGETRLFAGVAAALSSLPRDRLAGCAPARPIHAMVLAGDADPRVPFNGGKADLRAWRGEIAPVADTVQAFARAAGCSGQTGRASLADRNRADASRITIQRYSACRARVSLVRVRGGGHFLPVLTSARPPVAGQNRDASTTALILSFFRI